MTEKDLPEIVDSAYDNGDERAFGDEVEFEIQRHYLTRASKVLSDESSRNKIWLHDYRSIKSNH